MRKAKAMRQYHEEAGDSNDLSAGSSGNYGTQSLNGGVQYGVKIPGKRRSKNDNWGRDFNCKYCEKQYLSYPALYTHIKQKHSRGPNG